jgi:catechol 2,3-dioxygenase-like lactoylglutathione lyase family enzyme
VRLQHVSIAIPPDGAAAARTFYGDLLGLEELPKPEPLAARGGCWFRAGAQELHVGVESPFAPARKAHPGLVVADLDALAARLRAAGIDVVYDETLPTTKRFHTADPFGNRLEFRAG